MLSVVMLSVVKLSVVILSVVAPSEGKLICISIDSTLILLHPGNTNWGGGLSPVDLLIKVACFVKNVNNIFNVKKELI